MLLVLIVAIVTGVCLFGGVAVSEFTRHELLGMLLIAAVCPLGLLMFVLLTVTDAA